ncbi:MAG: hypothetical protein H7Z43_02035, partial [Clostridia bacterium]|nr:hypothetical protein [Deltaproteobacteria bacterium]
AGLPRATLGFCKIDANGLTPDHYYSVVDLQVKEGKRWVVLRDPYARYKASYDTLVRDENGVERAGVFRIKLEDFRTRFRVVTMMTGRPLQRTNTLATAPETQRVSNAPPPAAYAFPCPSPP